MLFINCAKGFAALFINLLKVFSSFLKQT